MKLCKLLILTFLLFLSVLWIWMGDYLPIQPFCVFHKLTGYPCPGCGGIRAARFLFSGEIMTALYTNPLSVMLCLVIPVCVLGQWFDYFRGTQMIDSFLKTKWNPFTIVLIVIITMLNWVWNIQKGL